MFKKLLYFFRKTSSHTMANSNANAKKVAEINATNVDSLENSVEKIVEEIEQTFTDWQHTGLSSIHPTEIEQCEALIEKLNEIEQEQALTSKKAQNLNVQLNNIKATMQLYTDKNSTSSDNTEHTDIKPLDQESSDHETVNSTGNFEERTFIKPNQSSDSDNNQEVTAPLEITDISGTNETPDTNTLVNKNNSGETVDTIERAYPVEIATTIKATNTSEIAEPLNANPVNDQSTAGEQVVDEQSNNTSDTETSEIVEANNSEELASAEPIESIFNNDTVADELTENNETSIQPSTIADVIFEQVPEPEEATKTTEKQVSIIKPNTESDSEENTLIYLPKLTIKTPLVCLEQAEVAENSNEYKKLPKRTKNMLDKHGEWVNKTANLPYKTDIAVEDKLVYLAFLKQLLTTLNNKKLAPEKKVVELSKIETQENWQPFITNHFGKDQDWKIIKGLESEVKTIKGISTKLAVMLYKQGYTNKEAICNAPDDVLLALPRVGKATLEKIRQSNS
ncbi:helix-hairpin-helix domain-containing protein [Spartinivicinus ruber]|uniref:helix-hairpin-helix domain-containing protein n=1 Tax=Spartinivicinus ruber TaxID=2683272 RepID=UPI0013D060A9|nr:helix-hairpin-helix domain-containing protein [Spartinivicinus ruber]